MEEDGTDSDVSVLGPGVALTAAVALVLWAAFGRSALLAAISFGLVATLIQVVAVAVATPALDRSFDKFMVRWGVGMGLRLAGVVLFTVAVLARPEFFPPLPTAFGFLGVLIPLLFMETRFLK